MASIFYGTYVASSAPEPTFKKKMMMSKTQGYYGPELPNKVVFLLVENVNSTADIGRQITYDRY